VSAADQKAVISPALRLRRPPRVRRDPIDISLVTVEAAEADPTLDADEVLAALEARRPARCVADPHDVWATDAPLAAPAPIAAPTPRVVPGAPGSGIAADQVQAWLAQVQDDLRKVRARVEYLRAEQARLDEQQRLMAQLLTTSTPL
jgi:hypothetical protein